MLKRQVYTSIAVFLLQTSVRAQTLGTAPAWFEAAPALKEVQAKAQSDGLKGRLLLEKFESRKVEISPLSQLTVVNAKYGDGKMTEDQGYDFSAAYVSWKNGPLKPVYKTIEKVGCASQKLKEATSKKLGVVQEAHLFFLQLQMTSPSCSDSEVMSPRVFVIAQEDPRGFEKVFQSPVSANGQYRIEFKKDIIRFEYTKKISEDSVSVRLVWDTKSQKFVEE
jgi:hypothetical protein